MASSKQPASAMDPHDILARISDNILVINKSGIIQFINYVLPGYDLNKVVGTPIYDYIDKKSHAEIKKLISHTWNTGEDTLYDIEYYDNNGRHIWYETRMRAFQVKGKTRYIVESARDMTVRHKRNRDLEIKKEELEACVEARTRQLDELNFQLNRKNQAIKEVLSQLEEEKKNLEQNIGTNFELVLMPILARLKKSCLPDQYELLSLMEDKLRNITSSYGVQISGTLKKLTASEIQICNLIRSGMKTKDIARILKCSHLTVDTHRTKIRKKLGISNHKVNLETYLQNLTVRV